MERDPRRAVKEKAFTGHKNPRSPLKETQFLKRGLLPFFPYCIFVENFPEDPTSKVGNEARVYTHDIDVLYRKRYGNLKNRKLS